MSAPKASPRVLPPTRAPIIGLIGPTGCGKTTVAGWLAARGAAVIDADDVTREVMGPGSPVAEAIVERFGPEYRRADGSLDRAALGRWVFADPERLTALESIVHPAVRERIAAAVRDADAAEPTAIVLEAIKLVEAGYAGSCDAIWLVDCDPGVQLGRLAARGVDERDALQRQAAQAPSRGLWRASATRILATDGPKEVVEGLVEAAFDEVVAARR